MMITIVIPTRLLPLLSLCLSVSRLVASCPGVCAEGSVVAAGGVAGDAVAAAAAVAFGDDVVVAGGGLARSAAAC